MQCPLCFDPITSAAAWKKHRDSMHGSYYPFYRYCKVYQQVRVVLSGSHCHTACDDRRSKTSPYADTKRKKNNGVLCHPCHIYLEPGSDLQAHYVRSVLHPNPCGACGTGFAVAEDYEKHVNQCPQMLLQRYGDYNESKPEEAIAKIEAMTMPPKPVRFIMPLAAEPIATSEGPAQETEHLSDAAPQGGSAASTSQSFHLFCRLCRGVLMQMDDPVVTPCGHAFCHKCIGRELTERTDCPVCHKTILPRLAID